MEHKQIYIVGKNLLYSIVCSLFIKLNILIYRKLSESISVYNQANIQSSRIINKLLQKYKLITVKLKFISFYNLYATVISDNLVLLLNKVKYVFK